jgi:hypothetical protein
VTFLIRKGDFDGVHTWFFFWFLIPFMGIVFMGFLISGGAGED